MGLSLYYRLSLPGGLSLDEVAARVEAFRHRCAELPFHSLEGRVSVLRGARLAEMQEAGFVWGGEYVGLKLDAEGSARVARKGEEADSHACIEPLELAHFRSLPGAGSETAIFGVARFPATFDHADPERPHLGAQTLPLEVGRGRWTGWWACKTQYAADPRAGGLDNFMRCHLTLVAALDVAAELGFAVEATDDGEYWGSRNPARLVAQLRRNEAVVARFYGALKDELGDEDGTVLSPIAERPDFERVEAGALPPLPAGWDEVVSDLIRRTARPPAAR